MSGLRTNSNNPTLKGGEKHIYWKSSAPGSEAVRDKWLLQKNDFLEQNSAPGSEAAPDKWRVQKNV